MNLANIFFLKMEREIFFEFFEKMPFLALSGGFGWFGSRPNRSLWGLMLVRCIVCRLTYKAIPLRAKNMTILYMKNRSPNGHFSAIHKICTRSNHAVSSRMLEDLLELKAARTKYFSKHPQKRALQKHLNPPPKRALFKLFGDRKFKILLMFFKS